MTFICGPCRDQDHEQCKGGTYCDCLHRVPKGDTSNVDARDLKET